MRYTPNRHRNKISIEPSDADYSLEPIRVKILSISKVWGKLDDHLIQYTRAKVIRIGIGTNAVSPRNTTYDVPIELLHKEDEGTNVRGLGEVSQAKTSLKPRPRRVEDENGNKVWPKTPGNTKHRIREWFKEQLELRESDQWYRERCQTLARIAQQYFGDHTK